MRHSSSFVVIRSLLLLLLLRKCIHFFIPLLLLLTFCPPHNKVVLSSVAVSSLADSLRAGRGPKAEAAWRRRRRTSTNSLACQLANKVAAAAANTLIRSRVFRRRCCPSSLDAIRLLVYLTLAPSKHTSETRASRSLATTLGAPGRHSKSSGGVDGAITKTKLSTCRANIDVVLVLCCFALSCRNDDDDDNKKKPPLPVSLANSRLTLVSQQLEQQQQQLETKSAGTMRPAR